MSEFALKIGNVAAAPTPDGLRIEGDILNAGKTPHKVPRLRVALHDTAEREVQFMIVDPPVSLLAPGEIAHFKTQIQHPDETASAFVVSFHF
jgi:hypothetical protein